MCGICGTFINQGDPRAEVATVTQMSACMQRRGPDDDGLWTDGHHATFGFRRLAIIDLSAAGHQPMVTADEQHAIVFNGEVYNFRELRSELESTGVHFRSSSDTEVVLQSLVRWGPDALRRFNGMFALAWYDRSARRLLLARDPMGIKPLYYLEHGSGLAFGSQYDQLTAHPACDRSAVDHAVVGLYLRLAYMPAPYGVLKGTRQLRPGHYLTVGLDQALETRPYYEWPRTRERLLGNEATEAVDAAVRAAVTRQLVSDAPLGAFLSGGVDSPLVAAIAREAIGASVSVFTIGSSDPRFDETDTARAYAEQLDLRHTVRTFTDQDALSLIGDVANAYGEPFADYSALPTLMLSSVARESVKVALSGDGGDELFWGFQRFAKVLGARQHFLTPRAVRFGRYATARVLGRRRPPRGILFPTVGDWHFDAHSGLRDKQLRRAAPSMLAVPDDFRIYDRVDADDPDDLAQWLRWNEIVGHLQMVLLKVDRASMYHGLEVRVPLLDLEVVACAARIAPEACVTDGVGKQPLRQALARRARSESIPIPKRGFSVPMGAWLRRELRPVVESLLLDRDPFPAGAFVPGTLRSIYTEHLEERRDHTRGLWSLLALQLWADRHLGYAGGTARVVDRRLPMPGLRGA